MSELIKQVSADGIITQFELVSSTALNVKRIQDTDAIIDLNKADQNDSSFNNGYTPSGDLQHVGRVPLVLWEKWYKDAGRPAGGIYGKEMMEIAKKHLNDPDNKFLRTGQGELK